MAIYFIDSSGLVKRYVSETGSAWILGLFDPALNNEVFIAAITSVEIIAAITRRSRSGSISITDATVTRNQFKSDLRKDYQIVEITESIINSGMFRMPMIDVVRCDRDNAPYFVAVAFFPLLPSTLATNDGCSVLGVGDSPRSLLRRWFFGTPPAMPYSTLLLPYRVATAISICSVISPNSSSVWSISRYNLSKLERALLYAFSLVRIVSIRVEKADKVSPLPKSKFGSIEFMLAARRTAFSNIREVLF
jgi:hypothetical protein